MSPTHKQTGDSEFFLSILTVNQQILQDSLDQCLMPINADQNSGILIGIDRHSAFGSLDVDTKELKTRKFSKGNRRNSSPPI